MRYDMSKVDPITGGLFKYVRFADGDVVFVDACQYSASHTQTLEEKPGVPPVAAGAIKIRKKKWVVDGGGSMMLKIPRGASDEKYIGRVLEPLGFRYDQELLYGW